MKVYLNHDVLHPEGVSRSIFHEGISRVPEIFIVKMLIGFSSLFIKRVSTVFFLCILIQVFSS